MKVKSVAINNYKSFGEENSRIDVDSINTIIGKNESGKSNLIEAVGCIGITGMDNADYFKNKNKNTNKEPTLSLVITPYESENEFYTSKKETIITIHSQYNIEFNGGLTEIIANNMQFQSDKAKMKQLFDDIYLKDDQRRNQMNRIVGMIDEAESKVFIDYTYVDEILSILQQNEEFKTFYTYFNNCIEYLRNINSFFPNFIHLDNIELKTQYTREYLRDNSRSKLMLKYLLKTIGMNLDELMNYWTLQSGDDKINFAQEINEKIDEVVNEFNKFYKQEKVKFIINFDSSAMNLAIKTNKKYLDISERSNGLKWYFNMYIQLIAKTKLYDMKNLVILLDEPGVYLHVNAQKELLNLFEDFASKENQIIYTTQLPSMIYQEDLHRIRSIIKDDDGNSHIGNKYYVLPHNMASKLETITPVLTAIGMSMKYSFSAMDDSKINIITEGISDYNYVRAFLMQVVFKKDCNVIPGSGVDNIHNLVSILTGWGYSFRILIDQDKEGRKENKVLRNKLLVEESNIQFVDGTSEPNSDSNMTIEDLFSEEDRQNIGRNNGDYDKEKAYYSLEILKKVEADEYKFDAETIEKFTRIMEKWLN